MRRSDDIPAERLGAGACGLPAGAGRGRRAATSAPAAWAWIGTVAAAGAVIVALWRRLATTRRRAVERERALGRRDRIMNAVGEGAERLLRAADARRLNEFLGLLGAATGVSRVYIFRNSVGPRGELRTSQLFEWVAPGETPQIDRPELQDVPYEASGMGRWRTELSAGRAIGGRVAEFPESERPLLTTQGIRSIVVLPIFIGQEWWGFMGFDETRYDRDWSSIEVDALRTAAGLVGATIERRRAEARLRQLQRANAARSVAEATARRSRFLAWASAILSARLDYEATFRRLAHVVVPELADLSIVDVLVDGECRRLEVVAGGAAPRRLVDRIRRAGPPRGPDSPIRRVIDSGESGLYPEITPALLRDIGAGSISGEPSDAPRPRAAIVLPLRARGHIVGALTLIAIDARRRYGRDDVALSEELAGRAALALENARLYAEAREAARLRDDVLATVSHDLRNPLNTIALAAGVLRDVLPEPGPAARRQLDTIVRSVERADRLIRDLLDVARMEAGGLSVKPARVATPDLVREAVELHRELVAERGLELVMDLPDRLPDVWADRDRLLQVFANVLGNAIKFTPEGGRIEVEAAAQDNVVRFRVSDTGPGIDPRDAERLFDPFWQAARGTTEGAGLGLAISRGLVEAHGGRIWAEGRPGKGTTVSFTIPVARGRARERSGGEGGVEAGTARVARVMTRRGAPERTGAERAVHPQRRDPTGPDAAGPGSDDRPPSRPGNA
ncbi:MAG TPA: GAF domain-containing sensor histidine kinase [Longimicrobiales bacterium]